MPRPCEDGRPAARSLSQRPDQRKFAISSPHSGTPLRRDGHLFMVGVAVACGLAGAIGAVLFRLMIRTVQAVAFEGAEGVSALVEDGLFTETTDPLRAAASLSWAWRIAIPTVGGLIVGPLIYFFAREARGHGVPEVIKAIAVGGGMIRLRVVAIKSLASALSIGTGGSVGREGPIVQIASAVASGIGQLLRVPPRQLRTIVGCGAAAGISATFNAPIAGAIFAAEIIIGDFAVSHFSPIVIASVVATVVSRFALGNHPAFVVPTYEIVSPFEIAPYMVAGVLAGLVAVVFIRMLSFSEDTFERLPLPEWSRAGLGGLLVGGIAVSLPQIYGVGYTTIGDALQGNLPTTLLGALLIAKVLATTITLGSGGSGGIFAPSLFLGAMTGGFLGTHIHAWFPDSTASSGAYALVTMGAVVAAATQAPISAILIIFELTQTIDIVPALMVACVLSSLTSQLLSRDSIYTAKLRRQGIDIFKQEDPNALRNLFVRDIVDREPEVINADASFQQMLDLVVRSRHTQFFVESREGSLLGVISLNEVRRLIFDRDTLQHLVVAGDLVEALPATVTVDDDLDVVMHLFSGTGIEELAVVDSEDRHRLLGTVSEHQVIEARNHEEMRRDLAGGVAAVGHGQPIALGGHYVLQQVVAPANLLNRSLRDLGIRERTGVHVLLIRSGQNIRVPDALDIVREGDELVIAGPREAIESLESIR